MFNLLRVREEVQHALARLIGGEVREVPVEAVLLEAGAMSRMPKWLLTSGASGQP